MVHSKEIIIFLDYFKELSKYVTVPLFLLWCFFLLVYLELLVVVFFQNKLSVFLFLLELSGFVV